jgi:hypothetical protein
MRLDPNQPVRHDSQPRPGSVHLSCGRHLIAVAPQQLADLQMPQNYRSTSLPNPYSTAAGLQSGSVEERHAYPSVRGHQPGPQHMQAQLSQGQGSSQPSRTYAAPRTYLQDVQRTRGSGNSSLPGAYAQLHANELPYIGPNPVFRATRPEDLQMRPGYPSSTLPRNDGTATDQQRVQVHSYMHPSGQSGLHNVQMQQLQGHPSLAQGYDPSPGAYNHAAASAQHLTRLFEDNMQVDGDMPSIPRNY